ncbi:MAG: glutamyl-tRNA reductase [Candidatus Bathyarchaeia archaeon]
MIVCLSVSHKKASLPLLESLNIPDAEEFMKKFCFEGLVQECVLLQTCHRVEIYCVVHDSNKENVINEILKFWSVRTGVSLDILNKTVETYYGKEALNHLFFLASGLESMVLGEDQILGQVRSAYVKAKKLRSAGLILEKVFMKAVNVGRRVRTETAINEKPVSISSVAVDLAEKDLGDLKFVKALVIGAGETGSIAAENLRKKGVKTIFIANRTFERGLELASKVGGKAVRFDEILNLLPKVDLVVAAVSVDKPIFKVKQVRAALDRERSDKGLYIIDLSQPRAFDEKLGLIRNVMLKNIDDLKAIVDENLRSRQAEAEKAKKIIFGELERFERQLAKLFVEPLVAEICRKFEEIRQRELARAVRKMGGIDEKRLAVVDRFSRELVERILQTPLEQLREAVLKNNDTLPSAAKELFGIKISRGEKVV